MNGSDMVKVEFSNRYIHRYFHHKKRSVEIFDESAVNVETQTS
jgi:hypothetical protein